jgi:hypothetical protein
MVGGVAGMVDGMAVDTATDPYIVSGAAVLIVLFA